jgi:signal recognition particle receptor subunit beta
VHFTTRSGLTVKIKVFTVPGQVMHNSTRRVLLSGADAIAFIADSQISLASENEDSFRGMIENLRENGIDPSAIPIVIQFNKRDVSEVRSDEELDELGKRSRERIYKAIAVRGVGVLETFNGLLDALWESLESHVDIGAKFGLSRAEFLAGVFRHLNVQQPPTLADTRRGAS